MARLMLFLGAGGASDVNKATDLQIRSILELTERMIALSEAGFGSCEDDGCLMLNGLVRESAYRLRDAAEGERQVHAKARKWRGEPA